MSRKTAGAETQGEVRPSMDVILKPPVNLEALKANTEHDPEGAEEFGALIRLLRTEGSRTISI
jgi:hypothetical protein